MKKNAGLLTRPFREMYPDVAQRRLILRQKQTQHPRRIAVVVEPMRRLGGGVVPMPLSNATNAVGLKCLCDPHITLAQVLATLRKNLKIAPSQGVYFIVAGGVSPAAQSTVAAIHNLYGDRDDDILYINYVTENIFGAHDLVCLPIDDLNPAVSLTAASAC